MAYIEPNTTQVYNKILDNLGGYDDVELRILLLINRQTLGWHKKRDRISGSQLIIKSGKKEEAIRKARQRLVDKGLIVVEDKAGNPLNTPEKRRAAGNARKNFYYKLNIKSKPKKDPDQTELPVDDNIKAPEEFHGIIKKVLAILSSIPGWMKRDKVTDYNWMYEIIERFPKLNYEEIAEDVKSYCLDSNRNKKANLRLRFRNFCRITKKNNYSEPVEIPRRPQKPLKPVKDKPPTAEEKNKGKEIINQLRNRKNDH